MIVADRVRETTTTTGTGTIDLAGAVTGFQGLVAGIGSGQVCAYCIAHQSASEWEVGYGTVTNASPDTLSRTTITASSNSNAAVSFSAGTKDVFATWPATSARHLLNQPEVQPGTPNALNDEFDDGPGMSGAVNGLVGWTWRNQGSSTATFANGCILVTCPANGAATNVLRGIERTVSGAFNIRAKISSFNPDADFSETGLWVIDNANGDIITWGSTRSAGDSLAVNRWTNVTTFAANPFTVTTPYATLQSWHWLEIESDATTLFFRFSLTGIPGTFRTLHSETLATFIGTVTRVGLFANAALASTPVSAVCESFRQV
jgi:hypothetical protein